MRTQISESGGKLIKMDHCFHSSEWVSEAKRSMVPPEWNQWWIKITIEWKGDLRTSTHRGRVWLTGGTNSLFVLFRFLVLFTLNHDDRFMNEVDKRGDSKLMFLGNNRKKSQTITFYPASLMLRQWGKKSVVDEPKMNTRLHESFEKWKNFETQGIERLWRQFIKTCRKVKLTFFSWLVFDPCLHDIWVPLQKHSIDFGSKEACLKYSVADDH